MNTSARIYITILVILGILTLWLGIAEWRPEQPIRFAAFLAVAAILASLKAALPAIAGGTSFTILFILLSLLDLTFPEALLIGCVAVLIESVWKRGRGVTLTEANFAVANTAVATTVAWRALGLTNSQTPDWMQIGLAATALFAFTTFPQASVTALSSGVNVVGIWRREHFAELPYFACASVLAWGFHRLSGVAGWSASLMGLPLLYLVYRMYRLYRASAEEARQHEEELSELHMRTIETLALAVEAKDTTTSDHLRRVQVYALELGRELGMGDEELHALRAAAILHDIGKLAVPEYIISKPGRLTPDEFEKMKIHPIVGAEIIERVQFPYPVAPIVRAHHERWDGRGYPYGLRGTDIPLGARILSAVDTLDALASDRQYRRALPLDEAMAKVVAEAGRSLDPDVVAVLQRRYVEFERKAQSANTFNLRLSLDVRVLNGLAPAAGFEQTGYPEGVHAGHTADDAVESISWARDELRTLVTEGASASRMDLSEFCAVFGIRLGRVIPHESFVLWILRDGVLHPAFVHGHDHRLFLSLRIPVGQGLSGWVVENRKPVINGNPCVESGYLKGESQTGTLGAALAIPLEGSASVIGALALYQESRDAFTRDHLTILQSIAPRLATAVEELVARKPAAPGGGRGTEMATLIRQIDGELLRARRLNLPLGVVMCSLDGARDGGPESEAALRTLAGAVTERRHDTHSMAQISVTEFALVLPGTTAQALEDRTMALMRTPFQHPRFRLAAGSALYPTDGGDAAALLAAAERRLLMSRIQQASPGWSAKAAGAGWMQ